MHALLAVLPEALSSQLTPKRRDILVLFVALALLLSPLPVALGYVGGIDYQYESTEVVTTGDTVAFADASGVPAGTPISEDIACSGNQIERACALEFELTDGTSLSLGVESENPEDDPAVAPSSYEFVQVNDQVYRAVYRTAEDGSVEVALSSTSASTALHAVSLTTKAREVPDVVAEAAETGEATSTNAVDVPRTPIVIEGNYYRVYVSEEGSDASNTPLSLGLFFTAALGGILLLSLTRKVRLNYYPDA